jgi:Holliday junction resolvase RusA-like endonuclease
LLREAAVAARPPGWDSSGAKLVNVEFCFQRPPSHLTKKGLLRKGVPAGMVTHPDLDKCARAVGDALTDAGVVNDDRQIVRWVLEKMYCPEDFVHVTVRDWS